MSGMNDEILYLLIQITFNLFIVLVLLIFMNIVMSFCLYIMNRICVTKKPRLKKKQQDKMNKQMKLIKYENMHFTLEELKYMVGEKIDVNKLVQTDKKGGISLVDGVGIRKEKEGVYHINVTNDLLKKINKFI